jgi:PAS domain S-box-containing protein
MTQPVMVFQQSEAAFRLIFFSNPVPMWICDQETLQFLEVNQAAVKLYGYSREEFLGMGLTDIHPPHDVPRLLKHLGRGRSELEFWGHWQQSRKDGRVMDVEITSNELDLAGRPAVLMMVQDITPHLRTEDALAVERERFAVTFNTISEAVITTDGAGTVLAINAVAEVMTGWTREEATGQSLAQVLPLFDEKTRQRVGPVPRAFPDAEPSGLRSQTVLISKDGTERMVTHHGTPMYDRDGEVIGLVLVVRDVTRERRMEEELVKAQRLESLSTMAGGIAHDFNNILLAILGNISLAKMSATPGSEIHQRLTAAEKPAQRARDLAQQLLTISKGGTPLKQAVSVTELVKESARLAFKGSRIQCDFIIADNLWALDADEGQMKQTLHNIMANAEQAMSGRGIVQIKAANVVISESDALPIPPGEYVVMSVKDQGVGIPAEHMSKIFDSYFTTKPQGLGLGLTTAYSIVKRHDGLITVDSQPGLGTTVRVYLPAAETEVPADKGEDESVRTGHGRVLIMDDEEIVRDVVGQMLTRMGYDVEFALNGTEAIEVYRRAWDAQKPFDAVILDLTIPMGIGVRETMKRLRDIDPQVRAVVSSGFSNDPMMREFKKFSFAGALAKPYRQEELGKMLHNIIAGVRR